MHSLDRAKTDGGTRFRDKVIPQDEWSKRVRSYEHPVIYRAPHLVEPVLFVNEFMTDHISGMDRAESNALLDELFSYIYADSNVYTHRWQNNDLVIWDNIALQHCRPDDMGSAPRHLRRLSLDGWYADDGVIEWYATSSPRDLATAGAAYRSQSTGEYWPKDASEY
jgi:alpha-ketoglutarate-dependent taurine dioxygenase